MAVTKAQICNLALAHINQTKTQISDLDTDQGTTAIQCRIHYDVARRFVLADHNWNFATKRVALAVIGSPPSDWLYRYDYPSDCLRAREIQRFTKSEMPIAFKVEDDGTGAGLCILTDKDEATLIYTKDVTNPALFTPGFVSAMAWYLASELAPALSGDEKKQQQCYSIYRGHLSGAHAADSSESFGPFELESPWQRARGNAEIYDNFGRVIES